MKIGELAARCECPAETIRYYEKIGLLPASQRAANGYRHYSEHHYKWLKFILRSRELGFTQDQVRRLATIAHLSEPPCDQVHGLFVDHVGEVREKLRELKRMERALVRLKAKCKDGSLHDCPVIDELMG